MFAAICRLHSMIGKHDQIVVDRHKLKHLCKGLVDLFVRVENATLQDCARGFVVWVTFVKILPEPMSGFVGFTEYAEDQMEIFASDEVSSQLRLHLNAGFQRRTELLVALLRVTGIPMRRHGVLADVRPNVAAEGAWYRRVTPVSEFCCPFHHLQASHIGHWAVAWNIGQSAA